MRYTYTQRWDWIWAFSPTSVHSQQRPTCWPCGKPYWEWLSCGVGYVKIDFSSNMRFHMFWESYKMLNIGMCVQHIQKFWLYCPRAHLWCCCHFNQAISNFDNDQRHSWKTLIWFVFGWSKLFICFLVQKLYLSDKHISGLSVDWIRNAVYWTSREKGRIKRMDTNGKSERTLVRHLTQPNSIVIDPTKR